MSKRILLVEDDPDGQEVIETILEYDDFVVDIADDGERATTMIFNSEYHYDAIIIDLALPGKNGWQLLSDILANPDTNKIACIAVTAFHTSKLREQALKAGFTAYFPKPIKTTPFLHQLGTLTRTQS